MKIDKWHHIYEKILHWLIDWLVKLMEMKKNLTLRCWRAFSFFLISSISLIVIAVDPSSFSWTFGFHKNFICLNWVSQHINPFSHFPLNPLSDLTRLYDCQIFHDFTAFWSFALPYLLLQCDLCHVLVLLHHGEGHGPPNHAVVLSPWLAVWKK